MGEITVDIKVRQYAPSDAAAASVVWNEVVEEGNAFPQDEPLDEIAGDEFFRSQSYTGVACDGDEIVGLYILHPNNVGRCGHICNASYAVRSDMRGKRIGAVLVKDCMEKARELGYGILQFNAVVATNTAALKLYKSLGFTPLGVIPKGFRMKDGSYEDIIPHYISL